MGDLLNMDTLIQIYLPQSIIMAWSLMFGVSLSGAIAAYHLGKYWLRAFTFGLSCFAFANAVGAAVWMRL